MRKDISQDYREGGLGEAQLTIAACQFPPDGSLPSSNSGREVKDVKHDIWLTAGPRRPFAEVNRLTADRCSVEVELRELCLRIKSNVSGFLSRATSQPHQQTLGRYQKCLISFSWIDIARRPWQEKTMTKECHFDDGHDKLTTAEISRLLRLVVCQHSEIHYLCVEP